MFSFDTGKAYNGSSLRLDMQKAYLIFSLFLLCVSCQKYDLYLQQIPVTAKSLASYTVKSPDPRQKNPPFGQQIVINWSIPLPLLLQKPQVILTLIYRNHTEESFSYPIEYQRGEHVFSLLNEEYLQKQGILTYKAKIRLEDGTVYRKWKHQLWTHLITVEERASDA
ncbi:MAG: hypothetical protein QRY72_03150 [Candidatus Rhabdochlamydia sp.]